MNLRSPLPFIVLGALSLSLRAQYVNPLPLDVLLGRPTDRSIAVSLLSTDSREIIVDYGTQSGTYANQSALTTLPAGAPTVVTLAGLQPDTSYFYRVRHRTAGTTAFSNAPEASFSTQRAVGKTFTFDIEADPHYQDNEPPAWTTTLANVVADKPDFLIDLGDTFMDEKTNTLALSDITKSRQVVRATGFAQIGASVPLFLVSGNHDPELGWLLSATTPQANPAVWGTQMRQLYFPCPVPGTFYSGSTATDPYTTAVRDAYYSFEWGNALFIALDPFWYSNQTVKKSNDPWAWTLGKAQYDWLTRTLSQSKATFKFIFMHHLVGGSFDALARGGVEFAPYFEWGGKNLDDTNGFASQRPGWAMPIQDLLLANKVSAVFHGHDHLYIKQDLLDANGASQLVYQEVPQPSRTNQNITSAVPYGYRTGVMYPSSGHVRVTVAPTQATVEYVRGVNATDTRAGIGNGAVQHRYTINASASATGTSRLVNLSVRSTAGGDNAALIAGFVVSSGDPLSVLLRGSGPALNAFGVTGTLADPVLTLWSSNNAVLASNDDWGAANNVTQILAAAAQVGAFAFPAGGRDAALLSSLSPGAYTAQVSGKNAAAGTALIEAYDASSSATSARFINVSARTQVGTGGAVLIAGFVVLGTAPKQLLIRGVGPTLAAFGVPGVLADPQLALFQQGVSSPLQQNDNWSTAANAAQIASAASAVGAFALPANSRDAAMLVTLPPGTYSAQVSGVGNTTGVGLVEIYEVSSP